MLEDGVVHGVKYEQSGRHREGDQSFESPPRHAGPPPLTLFSVVDSLSQSPCCTSPPNELKRRLVSQVIYVSALCSALFGNRVWPQAEGM